MERPTSGHFVYYSRGEPYGFRVTAGSPEMLNAIVAERGAIPASATKQEHYAARLRSLGATHEGSRLRDPGPARSAQEALWALAIVVLGLALLVAAL